MGTTATQNDGELRHHSHDHTAVAAAKVVDPVCGMTIDPADAVGHVEYNGRTYYFCHDSCLERFRADPASFLEPARTAPAGVRKGSDDTDYTCPMDPEVRQKTPGACPKCGMAHLGIHRARVIRV